MKNQTKKIGFKKLNCSPISSKKTLKNSCYNNKQILYLKKMFNLRHGDSKIKTNNINEIWQKIKYYYINICNRESCWLEKLNINDVMKKELMNSFSPKYPNSWKKNPNEWLSSLDILYVMKQYEQEYSFFQFIGPSPIDFDVKLKYKCVWNELCKFNLKEYIKNKKFKIGIIFNTDKHNSSGEHWISLFIDIYKKHIYFFDSAGNQIPNEIMILIKRIIKQGKDINLKLKYFQNYPVEHQNSSTECGVYALYFIINMLEGKKDFFKDFKNPKNIIKDEYIERYRKIYFNDEL